MSSILRKPLPPVFDTSRVLEHARRVIEAEREAVAGLTAELGTDFCTAIQMILAAEGRVVVTGMGKSGLVGRKISATLASTGTPSLFLHAADAVHGDLGSIRPDDIVLALSNSGESDEVIRLVRPVRDIGARLIAIVGDRRSRLSSYADVVIGIGDVAEACPMGMVPTASTTAMMVVGDALAMCLFDVRGLGREAYARFHPGGALGRSLMTVREVMRASDENPVVAQGAKLSEAVAVMTHTTGRPGATSVIDHTGALSGFFTDGDLRRLIDRGTFGPELLVADVMHRQPLTVAADQLVVEAARVMREHQVDQLPVVDTAGKPIGLLDIQDLLSIRIY